MTEEKKQNQEPQVEDLFSTKDIDTTITGIKKDSDTWIDQATEKTKAISGETYVKLDCGILTVNQLPELFILFVAVKTLCKVTLVCKKSSFLLVLLSDCLKKDRLHPFPKKNIFYFVSSQRIYF